MKTLTILFVLLLTLLATNQFDSKVLAQTNVTNSNLTLVGRWPDGPCHTTFVKGDYAYVGNGAAMDILDISNPVSPVRLGRVIIKGVVEDISVAGNYAYVVDGLGGFYIVDVDAPTSPHIVEFFDIGAGEIDRSYSICLSGNYAHVACKEKHPGIKLGGQVHIIEIGDPTSPKHIATYLTAVGAEAIQISGNYAYVFCRSVGLYIFDITNPALPQNAGLFFMTDSWIIPHRISSVQISGSTAYIACGYQGLYIIDVSTPASPQLISVYKTEHSTHSVFVSGTYAYVGAGDLCIIDVSDPGDPKQVGLLAEREGNVYVRENYAYVASRSNGLRVIDVSTPSSPDEVGFYSTGYRAHGINISDNYAYIAASTGLCILDIGKAEDPQKVSFFHRTNIDGPNLFMANNFAHLTDGDSLYIIDTRTANFPRQVGSRVINRIPGFADVHVSGNYAYVTGTLFLWDIYIGGLQIIDVTDPTRPRLIWSGGGGGGIYVSGNYAYVGSVNFRKTRLTILDVSTPSSPKTIGHYDIGVLSSIHVSGDYAYIGEIDSGLHIVDVSTPSFPKFAGKCSIEGDPHEIWVSDNFAYVAGGNGYLHLFDVSAPTSPQKAGSFDLGSPARGLTVSDNLVYLVTAEAGLYILRNDLITDVKDLAEQHPEGFNLLQNYPNPFNPTTTIDYDLPKDGHVKLVIYDVRGRHIRTLVDRRKHACRLQTSWDGTDERGLPVAGGLYFCRMQAGEFSDVIKMVIVR